MKDDDDEDDGVDSDDYDAILEDQLERDYQEYLDRKGTKTRRVRVGKKTRVLAGAVPTPDDGAEAAVEDFIKLDADEPAAAPADAPEERHPLVHKEQVSAGAKADLWFSQAQFAGLESEDEDQDEEDMDEDEFDDADAMSEDEDAGANGQPDELDDDDDNELVMPGGRGHWL